MKADPLHLWTLDPEEAVRIQERMRERIVLEWDGRVVRTVAGIDSSFPSAEMGRAAIVVLSFPELVPIEAVTAEAPVAFPYVPGLLSFREAPAIIAAWEKIKSPPDLLMLDGQGIAHPRGIGIAAHLGVWFEAPSIGVAKSHLYGSYQSPGEKKGDRSPLHLPRHPEKIIGAVLRSRDGVKPLFVSPGHRIDPELAVDFVLRACTRYRLPEPTRWAHRVAGGEAINLTA
jgi:deoxyribonuclease V